MATASVVVSPCGGSCDGGGDCCGADGGMVGQVKRCWLVRRWQGRGSLWPVGPRRCGDGEGCEAVAVVVGLGAGLVGSSGAILW